MVLIRDSGGLARYGAFDRNGKGKTCALHRKVAMRGKLQGRIRSSKKYTKPNAGRTEP